MNNEILIVDTNSQKDEKGGESGVIENEESLTEIEDSLVDMCKKTPTKELTIRLENIFCTSGGQKRSPSNKENQTSNIINDTSAEKSIGLIITNVSSLSTKSSTTVFANKPLNEKEIKFSVNEQSLNKCRQSSESTEIAVKHTATLKECDADSTEETDSLNPIAIQERKDTDNSSINDTTKKRDLVHDVDKKLTTTNDTIKSVSSPVYPESVEKIIDNQVEIVNTSDVNVTEVASKLDESSTNRETYNKTIDNQEDVCSLTANDDEMKLELEKSNLSQDKNKSLNESMKTLAEPNSDHSSESINVETCTDKSIAIDKLAFITQDGAKDNLLDSTEQTKNDFSTSAMESTLKSSNTTLETINPSSSNLSADSATIQSRDVMKVLEEPTKDIPPKVESVNTSLKMTSTQRENKDISFMSTGEQSSQLEEGQKNSENIEIDDDKLDIDIINISEDIPTDNPKEDVVETKDTVEDESNPLSVDNESEAECDLVLVDKQAWLAAENIKAMKDKECFDYDSDDTVLLKSRSDAARASKDKKELSTINEALLINIDDDNEEEEEQKQEEKKEEEKVAKLIKRRKSLIKEKSASGKGEDFSTMCIDVDSSSTVEKFVNKSKKGSNQSSSRPASGLNKSGQAEQSDKKILDESDDEIECDTDRFNRSSLAPRNTSLRKSTGRRESLNKSSKNTSSEKSFQSIQNISKSKSQGDNSEEELDDIETHKESNLEMQKESLHKSEIRNKDTDMDEVECESKESPSDEENGKKDKKAEDSDEDEVAQAKDFKCTKNDINYSMLALASSTSNDSNKSNDDTSNDSIKHYKHICNLFKDNSDTDDDDDGVSSINSDIQKEYNLRASEQKYSDDDVPYDECRTSELEFSDSDDNGSDLADFIVADDAIEEDEKGEEEEEEEEQNDEDDGQETEEDEVTEQEKVEDEDVDDEQVEDAKEENYNICAEEDEKSVGAESNASKSNASDKSFEISKNKRKMSAKHIVPCQLKKEDIKAKKSHTKNVEETIVDTSGSTSPIKPKKKLYVEDESDEVLIKLSNEGEISRKKLLKRTSMECSTPKINSSKQEFMSDVETAATALEAADEKSNSMSESLQRKKRKSRKDSILKENSSFKEPKRINNEEKLLHNSLPSDLLEKGGKTKPISKTIQLNKSMNVTHTETPTIRDLRKEKLNESAPELKLETETTLCQLQKKRLSKKKDNIAEKKTDEGNNEEEVCNLIALFKDSVQEPSQRKQKKRKRQAEDTSNENIIENVLPQDAIESDVPKQKKKKKKKKTNKNDTLSSVLAVENTTREDACQFTEKKKKKKIGVTITGEDVKIDNMQQEDTRRQEKGKLHKKQDETQHSKKKKKDKVVINVESDNTENTMIVEQQAKQQKTADNTETLPEESLKKNKKKKKKKEEEEKQKKVQKKGKILSPQTKASTSKSKSNKETKSEKLQLQEGFLSKTVESKNAAFAKARREALEAIKSVTERIKLNKELKKKQKKTREENSAAIEEQDIDISVKRKKTKKRIEEPKQKISPLSMGGLKRLSHMIDEFSDVPIQAKKRKLLHGKEQVISSQSTKKPKSLESKVKSKNVISLSSSGSTTHFIVEDLSKIKKRPSKIVASVMSYRQQMLNRNNREPTSSYLMYLQKQRTVPKDGFSGNAF